MLAVQRHENGVDDPVDLIATLRGKIGIFKGSLDPLHLARFNPLHHAIMYVGIRRGDELDSGANLQRLCTPCPC